MAQSTLRRDGSDTYVYVASSAPTAAGDETDAAYSILGLLISNSSQAQAATTDASDKDGTTKLRSNNVTETIQLQCHHARNDDDGQVIVDAAMESGAVVYVLEMPETVGLKGRSYAAIVQDRGASSANGAAETVSYTLGLTTRPTSATKA